MFKELKFEGDDPVFAKDANTKDDDWFDIYDPRTSHEEYFSELLISKL